MIYQLFDSDKAKLLTLPETGMGYQIIQATKTLSFETREYVVYNAEIAIDADASFLSNRTKIVNLGFSEVKRTVEKLNIRTDSIVLERKSQVKAVRDLAFSSQSHGVGALDSPTKFATGSDYYVRISAYGDDKRIDTVNNCLTPGTFTTTLADYENTVRQKYDPVDRYALPNEEPVKWAFFVKPSGFDTLQEGIVQPAFGHRGGGVEDYFKNGTASGTYKGRKPYGEAL